MRESGLFSFKIDLRGILLMYSPVPTGGTDLIVTQ